LDRSNLRREAEEKYLGWAREMDESTVGRLWVETLEALQKVQEAGVRYLSGLSYAIVLIIQTQVPEITFQELSQHLAAKSTVKDLKKIGLVVVRDVISDTSAQAAGEEIRSDTQARNGHCKFLPSLFLDACGKDCAHHQLHTGISCYSPFALTRVSYLPIHRSWPPSRARKPSTLKPTLYRL
jgi:hypothetical protein